MKGRRATACYPETLAAMLATPGERDTSMTKASHIVQGCVIISALLLGGCSHDGPTSPPAGNGSLSLGFSLRAANDAGVTVSRVNVKVTKGAFVDSLDLTISADSAWGTFANLVIGEYSI